MDATDPASPLAAELARWLTAFAAGVQAARAAAPEDRARPLADEILDTVARWLVRPRSELPAPAPALPPPQPATGGWATLLRQAGAERELPDLAWEQLSFAAGWEPFHLALLGLPPERATTLAHAASQWALAEGCAVDLDNMEETAGTEDRLLVPGLSGAVSKKGIVLLRSAPLPADFLSPATGGELLEAVRTAATVATLVSRALPLYAPNPDTLRNDLVQLTGAQATAFRTALVEAVRTACRATTPRDLWLAWVKLDEAIHNAILLPLAHPQSWWGLLSYRQRQALSQAAEKTRRALGRVDLQVLRGDYRLIRKQSEERADVRTTAVGHPGQVVVCLRVFTAIADERFVGRVLYRP